MEYSKKMMFNVFKHARRADYGMDFNLLPDVVFTGSKIDCQAYKDGALSRNMVGASYDYSIHPVDGLRHDHD
jgi:hypothetical protein